MEPNQTSDKTNSNKEEIVTAELLENAKKNLNTNDYKTTMYYLNLAKFSNNYDIVAKINAFSQLSIVASKLKNEDILIHIGRKLLKYLPSVNVKSMHPDILMSFIRILLKVGLISNIDEQEGKDKGVCVNLLAFWFYYLSRNIYTYYELKSDDIHEVLKNLYPKLLKRLSDNVSTYIYMYILT
jgi:hypothetical protein